jgi:hypothetical protein
MLQPLQPVEFVQLSLDIYKTHSTDMLWVCSTQFRIHGVKHLELTVSEDDTVFHRREGIE